MVDKNLLMFVSQRLNQILRPSNPDATFGGLTIIAVGDFHQIPPVFGKSLLNLDAATLAPDLWSEFSMIELTEIMRQKDDQPFAQLLNRLRIKRKDDRLSNDDQCSLEQRLITNHPRFPKHCLHVFSRNANVDCHNQKMMEGLDQPAITITAVDIVKNNKGQHYKSKHPVKFYKNEKPPLLNSLSVAVGARVMVICNIDIEDGLVNGVMGEVTDISKSMNELGLPKYVGVKFDNLKVGLLRKRRLTGVTSDVVRIEPFATYPITKGTKTFVRHQFPLKLAWACTVHKIQGGTVSEIVVDMSNIFREGMGYVALSRVTNIGGLYIKNFQPSSIYTSNETCDGISRMSCLKIQNPFSDDESKHLKVIHHNTQSLVKHFEPFIKSNFFVCDVICLTETWMPSEKQQSLLGYQRHSVSRPTKGGGVTMYVKDCLSSNALFTVMDPDMEVVCIRVNSYIVCTVYCPGTRISLTNKQLPQKLKMQLDTTSTKILVLGDFNENLLSKSDSRRLYTSFIDYGFKQHINGPTTTNGSLIDHIYTYNIEGSHSGVLSSFYSYHDPVYLTVCEENCIHKGIKLFE